VASTETYPGFGWAVAGVVATIAQFREPDRDGGTPPRMRWPSVPSGPGPAAAGCRC